MSRYSVSVWDNYHGSVMANQRTTVTLEAVAAAKGEESGAVVRGGFGRGFTRRVKAETETPDLRDIIAKIKMEAALASEKKLSKEEGKEKCVSSSSSDDDIWEDARSQIEEAEERTLDDLNVTIEEEEEESEEEMDMESREIYRMEEWKRQFEEDRKIPDGFLKFGDVIGGVGDKIKVGEQHVCFTTYTYSPSDMYLSFASQFPRQVDKFIAEMSAKYKKLLQAPKRSRLLAEPDKIKPGMFVSVYKRDEKEWFRGEVLKTDVDRDYEVRLIDLGESHLFGLGDIFYLHGQFAKQPAFGIRARLSLSKYYDEYHKGAAWDSNVRATLFNTLYNRRFHATFLRRVYENEQWIWEVSIQGFEEAHPEFHSRSPYEKQLIRMTMNEYLGDEGEPTYVDLLPPPSFLCEN